MEGTINVTVGGKLYTGRCQVTHEGYVVVSYGVDLKRAPLAGANVDQLAPALLRELIGEVLERKARP